MLYITGKLWNSSFQPCIAIFREIKRKKINSSWKSVIIHWNISHFVQKKSEKNTKLEFFICSYNFTLKMSKAMLSTQKISMQIHMPPYIYIKKVRYSLFDGSAGHSTTYFTIFHNNRKNSGVVSSLVCLLFIYFFSFLLVFENTPQIRALYGSST